MEFNENGLTLSTLEKNLKDSSDIMKKVLGTDFEIKAEGVADNILVSLAKLNQDLEEQFAYLVKQFDPNTADGKYQDALYERIGLYRIPAEPCRFITEVRGIENETFEPESIIISDKNTNYRFTNAGIITTDESGNGIGTFKSILNQDVLINSMDEFEVIEPADAIFEVASPDEICIIPGRDEESDSDFRTRFFNIKNLTEKCTRNSVIKNLSEYVDVPEHLAVHDSNSDETIPGGSILITAKPNVDDIEFAYAIMENTLAGISYIGNTTVNLPLLNGDFWEVKFQKAEDILLELYAEIKIKNGYYQNSVFDSIRINITEYLKYRIFELGATVYSTEFIVPVLQSEGVEAVLNIKIKKQADAGAYSDYVALDFDELPVFGQENILLVQIP